VSNQIEVDAQKYIAELRKIIEELASANLHMRMAQAERASLKQPVPETVVEQPEATEFMNTPTGWRAPEA